MKPRILVPHDFGPSSTKALEWAADLKATVGDIPIHVIHVVNPLPTVLPGEMVTTFPEPDSSKLAQSLEDQVQSMRLGATTEVVRSSFPGGAIVEAARRVKAELIVMGTHGRSGLVRLALGSVAEYVVRHAPCPVVTIRVSPTPRSGEAA